MMLSAEQLGQRQMPYIKHVSSMKTFLIREIDNVIDIEEDLLYQCYK